MEAVLKADPADDSLKGQEQIWQLTFAFVESMTLKCAVELRIADIIHSHGGGPITLSQIAAGISASSAISPDMPYLSRVMRMLVRKKIFTAHHDPDHDRSGRDQDPDDGTLYGLNDSSKWLLWGSKLSLVPMVLMENHPWQMAPWHHLSECVRDGGMPYEKAHGCGIWDFASANPDFNKLFNDGMACATKMVMDAVHSVYKEGFLSIGSTLVDVGGGTGRVISEIVKSFPHIKGINFDLPHVVATAPPYDGVTHVAGDMFESVPSADAVFIKWVLHDWDDETCVKILKNCRKAMTADEKNGKVIIVDIVMEPNKNEIFDGIRTVFDMVMMAHTDRGKERTELEWNKLLQEAGFARYKITKISTIPSIIEAFPV